MPKFYSTIGAVAIIAFSIGFNVARYPMVWEMIGPAAHLPPEAKQTEPEISSQLTKAGELDAVPPAETSNTSSFAKNALVKLPHKNIGSSETKPFADDSTAKDFQTPQALGRLVAVPGNLLINSGRQMEPSLAVQRLPPVYQTAPIAAGHYAAEYPQSPIPIYPSTGMK
jgi:hypothetical protein